MENLLLDALGTISEKLKNHYNENSTLERTICLVKIEVEKISVFLQITKEEAAILSAIAIRKIDKIFLQCNFSDIANFLGISNLELTKSYEILENLEQKKLITKEVIEIEKVSMLIRGAATKAVLPSIKEFGYQYHLGENFVRELFK